MPGRVAKPVFASAGVLLVMAGLIPAARGEEFAVPDIAIGVLLLLVGFGITLRRRPDTTPRPGA